MGRIKCYPRDPLAEFRGRDPRERDVGRREERKVETRKWEGGK